MSIEENVQLVKNFFAAMGSSNARDLLALAAEDIEWIIPGEGVGEGLTYLSESYNCIAHNVSPILIDIDSQPSTARDIESVGGDRKRPAVNHFVGRRKVNPLAEVCRR